MSADDDERASISKKISWILRHGAKKVALIPDESGWIKMADLLKVEILDGIAEDRLMAIIADSNTQKRRYELKNAPDGQLIKAVSREKRREERDDKEKPAPAPAVQEPRGEMRKDAPVFVPKMPAHMPVMTQPTAGAYPFGPLGGYPGYPGGYPGMMGGPMAGKGMPMQQTPLATWAPQFNPYGAAPAVQEARPSGPPSDGRYRGKIKSFNSEKGFGFIESADAHAAFGRDVFLHKAHVGNRSVGADVTFTVETNKQGMPQARDLASIGGGGGGGCAPAGKGEKGKGKGKTKGDGEKGEKGKAAKKEGKGKGKDKKAAKEPVEPGEVGAKKEEAAAKPEEAKPEAAPTSE